ncbi:VCBS repeat-containing protein [Adhaeribacter pallidiroseus]|nr:VCBS repeat-containing protein [Adhaeribacter pallidiroseus]
MQKYLFLALLFIWGCRNKNSTSVSEKGTPSDPLFETLTPVQTNIHFTNQVIDDKEFNIFNYRNFYNGGGVAVGDVNQDGLADVFLISNMQENKLYLNKGKFTFEDITVTAGVAGKRAWSTGVTFADVNGDGLMDIYVCNAGNRPNDDRANELYICQGLDKNGIPTYMEKAAEYGLNDKGFSTHAAFFDYDRDNDLDMFLLNNSFIPVGRLQYSNLRDQRDSLGGHKFFRNDGTKFTDISEKAGIYGSIIGFGLGITIGDVNNDNWLDIYISNDFYEHDYLYINNKNGSFIEDSKNYMQHQSLSSMGADIADINNDGNLDIFVTDMLPGDDQRLKTTSVFESYDLFQLKLARDFHYQYMQNMLHLNNGNGTFSEIARLSGVHATDWSWGALLFDMDNDGLKDIFVANGIAKNLTDQDFVNFLADENNMRQMAAGKKFDFKEFLDKIPSKPIPNYAFKNYGNLQFKNKAFDWGLGNPNFSNGSAYGDLDNDGDLDLVVNNVNMPVSVYRNKSTEKLKNHFLRFTLKGYGKNPNAVGAKVYVHQPDKQLFQQQIPNRGFESSVDFTLVFGLGKTSQIDSVRVIWPDDKMQVLHQVKPNQDLKLDYQQANQTFKFKKESISQTFTEVTGQVKLNYRHVESNFVDYNRDGLLKQMLSTQGPALAAGDVNNDGLEDVFLGGAAGMAKKLFMQQKNGTFVDKSPLAFKADSVFEDVDAALFDADNDGDLDLYVVTGSNEFEVNAPELLDRFYLNDGKGNFTKDQRLPNIAENGSCVAPADYDLDGDLDLFIGSRMISGKYGYDPPSYLYINDGSGNFKNYTKRYLPKSELGMITDATWTDLNGDKYPELIVTGDWMAITLFKNNQGRTFTPIALSNNANLSGWWNTIKPADIDGDGDIDFILGNQGINSRIKATDREPAELYVGDFDKNGTIEQIISCYTEDGKSYPMVLKHDLQKQVPGIKKKFIKYANYANKKVTDIFSKEDLQEAVIKKATNASTCFLINEGNFKFSMRALPIEAQFSPVFGIETLDYNQDGILDILLTGNFYDVLPEIGRYDANYGLLLQGKGQGAFAAIPSGQSGLLVKGQVRRSEIIKGANGQTFLILAKNNDKLQVYRYQ